MDRDGLGNRQTPTALGAAALQHDAAVFRPHPNEEPMGPPAAPAVWLVGAFHGTPNRAMRRQVETGIVATGQNGVNGRVSWRAPFRSLFTCRCRGAAAVVNSPPLAAARPGSFPHLWKNLWKSTGFRGPGCQTTANAGVPTGDLGALPEQRPVIQGPGRARSCPNRPVRGHGPRRPGNLGSYGRHDLGRSSRAR